ncbi:hypothetical protein [Actinoplanes palleronii]|uniref:Uncharacterized protein n=1 Tax=Actinoplanes palleronii TaxID=113570 RepID=A0ABQ4BI42_9ACTN|nr:hypothetical protein [Actinoplanes palleronii]GIE69955.1 hypothetical protein Apa02nite_060630 [Actinoplanes palleronii]
MYFVYRSHYEGPLGKLVRRLPDATVLGWFRRGWDCAGPRAWVVGELGVHVYGLSSIFEAARRHQLPRPETTDQLRTLLHEHLYVEGDRDYIRLDEHSLRVRTDDDEVELAYFFLDDVIVAERPERLAYLVHEKWPLPDGPGGEPDAAITTYAMFLTFYDGASLEIEPVVAFPGVGLGDLAAELRCGDRAEWPAELRVLAALTPDAADPGRLPLWGEPTPAADPLFVALQRANRWPGFDLSADGPLSEAQLAEADALVAKATFTSGRRPEASLIRVGQGLAQVAMHCSADFGYQQWFLFDSRWVAAHPGLAASLLHYAEDWDPLS